MGCAAPVWAFKLVLPAERTSTNQFVVDSGESFAKETLFGANQIHVKARTQKDAYVVSTVQTDWSGEADGDLWLFSTGTWGDSGAGSVVCSGTAADDVRIFALAAQVAARIDGNLFLIASSATHLTSNTWVQGDLFIYSDTVVAEGQVGGDARIFGGTVTISGEWDGSLTVNAKQINITPGTIVHGDLVYMSTQPFTLDSSVQVDGTVTEKVLPAIKPAVLFQQKLYFNGYLFLAALLTGSVLLIFAPRVMVLSVRSMRIQPLRALLTGTLVLLIAPMAIGFAALLVVGIPLALILLAFYAILFYVSHITVALWVGCLVVRRTTDGHLPPSKLITALVVGLGMFYLLLSIPGMGSIYFVVASLGTGALIQAARQQLVIKVQIPPPPPPGSPFQTTPPIVSVEDESDENSFSDTPEKEDDPQEKSSE